MPNEFFILKDGDMWCAVPPHFRDFEQDPSGWGQTPEQAVHELVRNEEFQSRAHKEGWPAYPRYKDFVLIKEGRDLPYQEDTPLPPAWQEWLRPDHGQRH